MTGIISSTPAPIQPLANNTTGNPEVLGPLSYVPAIPNLPQNWTAVQTFSAGTIVLSGTGGTGQYLKQSTLNGAVTVGTISAADIPASVPQSVVNDTNVTGAIAGGIFTLGWTGTLAAARLNSNVVQSVVNETNITGSISGQALTFAWAGTLANARLANMNAFTIKGNVTGSSAAPTDFTIGGLTQKVAPAGTDLVLIQDQAASGALKYSTVSAVGASSGVSSLNLQTGALVGYYPPQGRLTLVTATPVMTSTQSAKTTIFYTPYHGNMVPLYDGTSMIPTVVAEISVLTTDTTKSPAAIGASKVNDWFVWNDAGTIRIGHGPDWTNDTTRSAGTALTMVNGILLNNASITNGPAASRGTYVGTTRSNGSSQLDWILGGSSAGGTAAFLGLWNTYNRVNVRALVQDSTASSSYAVAAWRAADASNGNRVSFVIGLQEDQVDCRYQGVPQASSATSIGHVGIGIDVTNALASAATDAYCFAAATNALLSVVSMYSDYLLGFHFLQALENTNGVSTTFNYNNGQAALIANLRM